MADLIFATCAHQPDITADDQVLAGALTALGIRVAARPWTDIDPSLDTTPILLRSTWDYHRVPARFDAWLASHAAAGTRVFNSPAIARSNIDKVYLQALERAGLAIPKTRWLDQPDLSAVQRTRDEEGWSRAVLKPRIAATAYGTHLIDQASMLSDADLAPARASGALLQEFVPEIQWIGEVSLVYFEGAFSHAVRKRAGAGDFRVQKDFGGRVQVERPSADALAFAMRVVSTLAEPCLYARVDLVEAARGPMLMELELIEPELYFSIVPESAPACARAIQRRLRRD